MGLKTKTERQYNTVQLRATAVSDVRAVQRIMTVLIDSCPAFNCYLHLCITNHLFLTLIAHSHFWLTQPLLHISHLSCVQEQMSLHLSLQGWCIQQRERLPVNPWSFWQDRLLSCFTLTPVFYPCMFSLCALPLF